MNSRSSDSLSASGFVRGEPTISSPYTESEHRQICNEFHRIHVRSKACKGHALSISGSCAVAFRKCRHLEKKIHPFAAGYQFHSVISWQIDYCLRARCQKYETPVANSHIPQHRDSPGDLQLDKRAI